MRSELLITKVLNTICQYLTEQKSCLERQNITSDKTLKKFGEMTKQMNDLLLSEFENNNGGTNDKHLKRKSDVMLDDSSSEEEGEIKRQRLVAKLTRKSVADPLYADQMQSKAIVATDWNVTSVVQECSNHDDSNSKDNSTVNLNSVNEKVLGRNIARYQRSASVATYKLVPNIDEYIKKLTKEKVCVGEDKYKCEFCDKFFGHFHNLKRHCLLHSLHRRPFVCNVCNSAFTRKHHLQDHNRSYHDLTKRFNCSYCQRSFNRKELLLEHEAIHKHEELFQCEKCSEKFITKRRLQFHMKNLHSENNFFCEICSKKFELEKTFLKHINEHSLNNTNLIEFQLDQFEKL